MASEALTAARPRRSRALDLSAGPERCSSTPTTATPSCAARTCIYRLLRILDDAESQVLLSEHLADETRHAWLWTERIRELGGAPLPIVDGYQVRIGRRAGVPRRASSSSRSPSSWSSARCAAIRST